MPNTELTGRSSDLLRVVLPAAARGDLAAVRRFLRANWRWAVAVGPHDRTMLWEACYRNRLETVAHLIERGADVNAAGTYCTPLRVDLTPHCVALRAGRRDLADLLAENGALTDIHAAAFLGDLAGVDAWLDRDQALVDAAFPATLCDPVESRADQGTLTKAVEKELSAIERDLARCLDEDANWARGVMASASALARERDEAFRGWGTAFRSHLERCEALIREVTAVAPGKRQVQTRRRLLLRRRLWLDRWRRAVLRDGHRPLHYAVAGRQVAIVKLLIARGAAVERDAATLLDWSMDADAEEILETLLAGGARLDGVVTGQWAADPRLKAIAERFGAEPHIDAPDGKYPILVDACRGNHNAPDDPARVRPLLAQGADITIRDYKGKTALHRASQAGFTAIGGLLLQAGAEVEARDDAGETPLFDAVRAGRLATVRMLLKAGASPAVVSDKGKGLLDLAKRSKKPDAAKILAALRKTGP